MKSMLSAFVIITITYSATWIDVAAAGDAPHGAKLFRQCAACHSINPGEHLTGPSLADIVGRKAGSADGFGRYSSAMRDSGLIWNHKTLDAWLKSPTEFIPGTSMRIQGIDDATARNDIIAYLESIERSSSSAAPESESSGGGMMGAMGAQRLQNLKQRTPAQQVVKIRHCGDAYHVSLGSGESVTFWEFNLRFKTDSSASGPAKGQPAILRSGMMGDRAFIIFSGPEEISALIEREC